jgi:ferredoxin
MGILRRFMRPSTRAFFEEGDREGLGLFQKIHGYIYARWCYHYIAAASGRSRWAMFVLLPLGLLVNRHAPFRPPKDHKGISFADSYHGKVVPLEQAKKLVTINRPVEIRNLEKIIPYKVARDIVLENPRRIALLDCPCRMSRPEGERCEPVDVCIIIGDPLVSFILDHHPGKARAITPEEAIEVLEATDARGNVHHAFFKDAMHGRFYAICNCCSCCCGAMQAQRAGIPMLCSSGYRAEVDAELCVGCGLCMESCQFGALKVREKKIFVKPRRCMGCGVCVSKCPKGALTLVRDEAKGTPLEIEKLISESARG